jgi:hypothetical protein
LQQQPLQLQQLCCLGLAKAAGSSSSRVSSQLRTTLLLQVLQLLQSKRHRPQMQRSPKEAGSQQQGVASLQLQVLLLIMVQLLLLLLLLLGLQSNWHLLWSTRMHPQQQQQQKMVNRQHLLVLRHQMTRTC